MKITSGILCALLAICYISPSNGKSIEKCQRELGLNDDMYGNVSHLGQGTKGYCTRNGIYNDFFIDKLDSGEKKRGYVNTKSAFYLCRDREQKPEIYDVRADAYIGSWPFTTPDGYHGYVLESCPENKRNGYFTIKCKKY